MPTKCLIQILPIICHFVFQIVSINNSGDDIIKVNRSIWKVCNTRNKCADQILFHIKQKLTKNLSTDIVGLFQIIFVIQHSS